LNFLTNPPLSLYVHLPWCERKCPYCDFNSHQSNTFDESIYISALLEDLHQDLPLIWGRQIHSIFIGGGTPSLFSAEAIHQLLSDLRACLNLNPAIEITLEANPGSADESRFKGYHDAGVNRLSIGIQSFNDSHLHNLGRIHSQSQALSAFTKARNAGFDNINLDLMYALPAQSLQQALEDVAQAINLAPEHISHYQLTIEPNTYFHAHPPTMMANDELSWDMQTHCQSLLKAHQYHQYEISAYARKGNTSRHNMNYWTFGDYLGIGAGAHGKITLPAEQRVIRRIRTRQPEAYLQQSADQRISSQIELSAQDLAFEFMLNALRLVDGFENALFSERTGLGIHVIESAINEALKMELLTEDGPGFKPSALGLQFHNNLQALFLDLDVSEITRAVPEIHF
jgi:oxygen-independent coproporphyrinogen-3 oxidase